jgi:hypothetical protein
VWRKKRRSKRTRSTEEKDEKPRTVMMDPRNLKRKARSEPSSAGDSSTGSI